MIDRQPLPIAETCETCRFWDQWENRDKLGTCRRHAPRPRCFTLNTINGESDDSLSFASEWPNTKGHEWCGEYQPATAPTATATAGPLTKRDVIQRETPDYDGSDDFDSWYKGRAGTFFFDQRTTLELIVDEYRGRCSRVSVWKACNTFLKWWLGIRGWAYDGFNRSTKQYEERQMANMPAPLIIFRHLKATGAVTTSAGKKTLDAVIAGLERSATVADSSPPVG